MPLLTAAVLARLHAHDAATAQHSLRVAALVPRLDAAATAATRLAALAHDVGKLWIPAAVLRKAGPLSEEEWLLMQLHPQQALAQLDALCLNAGLAAVPALLRAAALSHHERWDGLGYPDGLRGRAIPYVARLIAIADSLDAMTHPRPYARPRAWPEALAELERCAGTQFDPALVRRATAALRPGACAYKCEEGPEHTAAAPYQHDHAGLDAPVYSVLSS